MRSASDTTITNRATHNHSLWFTENVQAIGGNRERLLEIIEKFCQKGATSPERATTAEELGLPPEFKEAMKRRLGQTGIFVEVNGKYYLDEKRLEETREQIASRRFRRW